MKINDKLTASPEDMEEIQNIIGIRFENPGLLVQALLHGSAFSGDRTKLDLFKQKNNLENDNYDKLEYLGDSVLGLCIADYSYHNKDIEEYAKARNRSIEGTLTEIKKVLVANESLVPVARSINLKKYAFYGDLKNIEDIYADVIEAIIGAIYLDQGFTKSKEFISKYFDIKNALGKISYSNPKGKVKEIFDKRAEALDFILIEEEGPDHNKKFTVGLYIDDTIVSTGEGSSIKKAESDASEKYLIGLNGKMPL